jgi:hypothetical protein
VRANNCRLCCNCLQSSPPPPACPILGCKINFKSTLHFMHALYTVTARVISLPLRDNRTVHFEQVHWNHHTMQQLLIERHTFESCHLIILWPGKLNHHQQSLHQIGNNLSSQKKTTGSCILEGTCARHLISGLLTGAIGAVLLDQCLMDIFISYGHTYSIIQHRSRK